MPPLKEARARIQRLLAGEDIRAVYHQPGQPSARMFEIWREDLGVVCEAAGTNNIECVVRVRYSEYSDVLRKPAGWYWWFHAEAPGDRGSMVNVVKGPFTSTAEAIADAMIFGPDCDVQVLGEST